MLPVIFDKLGEDVSITADEGRFLIRFDAAVSDGFVYWLLSLGTQVEVLEPISLRDHVKRRLSEWQAVMILISIHSNN